ncbi:MAG: N-acetylmuramoyl-L-alanine amidase [Chloroflexota bacterium]
MPDDDHIYRDSDDEHTEPRRADQPGPGTDNIPASVAFMELMRQAAAKSRPQPSIWADPGTPARPRAGKRYIRPLTDAPEEPPAQPAPVETTASGSPPPPPSHYEAALQEQRIRRIKRREIRRRRRTVGVFGGLIRSVIVVVAAAVIMATIFTIWTPTAFLSNNVREELSVAIATSIVTVQPTALPTPNFLRRIGIVSGHRGPENDPGAVCPDGLTEAEINFNVAQLVVRNLRGRGYTVDLLDEFDPRLDGYQAAALVSIHANTCQTWPNGEVVSGYLIAAAAARITARGNDQVLVDCIDRHYAAATGLQKREGVTVDMTDYHTFREIDPFTPAAIIELGFMLADRQIMTEQPDLLARGITDGILCFMEPGIAPTLEPSPTPEPAPAV